MSELSHQHSLWPDMIHAYDVTLETAEQNLALDEALLARVDADPTAASVRFWKPKELFVVLGRSNQQQLEVNLEACAASGIRIFRRASGGGAVIVGPGCLCYSLVLPISEVHRSLGMSRVTSDVMSRTAAALLRLIPDVEVNGTSDLTLNGLKFSGNAQRWLRRAFIHHGTMLFNFDRSLCETFLNHPSREPSYRQSRRHVDFLANIPLTADVLQSSICSAWNGVRADLTAATLNEASQVAAARYDSSDWRI